MRETFECGDSGALVAYLYDECEPADRSVIAAHVAICAACAAEIAALASTREQLTAWTPPEADLGFVISRPAATPPVKRAAWWFLRPMPAWAQVAAAVLIFGAGLSLGVARGTMGGSSATVAATAPTAGSTISAADLQALEQRLRSEIAQVRAGTTRGVGAQAAAPPLPASEARALSAVEGQVMARVRALIEESEQRQQRELALRTAAIVRDFDSQRSVDLAQIQRSFGQMEGATSAEVREQRQLLNYLMRVSQGQ
jgi:anti-sigma factor RsiW